jgi:hypothetical protein
VRSWDGDRHAELVELDDAETMDEWDQETLEKAVAEKALEYNSNKPTEIVCVFET